MSLRTSGALVTVLVAVLAGACATQGDGGGNGGGEDASADPGADDSSSGPSPDAVVFGVDTGGGVETGDEPTDTVDAADDGFGSKSCAGLPDGTPCGAAPDVCHDAPACSAGTCAAPAAKPDGFVCATAPDDCHTDGTCKAGVCGAVGTRADGYNWNTSDTNARCCSGKAIETTVDSDCGACGIQCNASNGESCQPLDGIYFCRGCVASDACWSHCCSESFTPYSCAASDCDGNCSATYCPPGTHCVVGAPNTSDYCSY